MYLKNEEMMLPVPFRFEIHIIHLLLKLYPTKNILERSLKHVCLEKNFPFLSVYEPIYYREIMPLIVTNMFA